MKRLFQLMLLSSLVPLIPQLAHSQGNTNNPLNNAGRLQITTSNCSRNLEEQSQGPCARLVIDQLEQRMLSIRILARGEHPDASNQLTFAGTSKEQLQCQFSRCKIATPLELELSSISEVSYDRNGVAEELPKAWPVIGTCRLEAHKLSCEARSIQGQKWQASASF
jgi:hypothetical protein